MASEASTNSSIDNSTISNATKLPSEQGLTFNRRDFIQGGSTNREVAANGKETGVVKNETVVLSTETTSSYESFMTNHFDQLLSQKNIGTMVPDSAGNAVPFLKYLETNHPHEAKILSIITTDDGTKIDNQKLQNFLKTSKGMTIATQLLEDVTAQKLFMLGLSGVKNNPDGRLQVADELHIKLGIDQGRLNKFFEDHPNIEEAYHSGMLKLNALALTSFGGGWITSNLANGEPIAGIYPGIVGMVAGGATAMVGEVLRRTGKSIRQEGVTIDLKRNLDGMRLLQQNPQEIAYLKAITGVDMNDFEIVDNAIRAKDISQRIAESTRDPAEIEGEILQGLYARNKFLQDLGINPSKINGTAEQRFMTGRKGAAPNLESEKMGTQWERMIQDEFKPNQGGIRDKLGRKPGDAFFGTGNDAKLFIKETVGGTTTFRDPTPAEQDEYKKNPNDAKFQLQSRRIFYIDQSSGELKQWDIKNGPKLGTKGIDFRLEIGDIRPEVDLTLFQNPGAYITLSESFKEGFDKGMYSEVKPDNLDTEGNLKRYSEARRRVIEKMTNTFIVEEQERKAKKDQQAEEQRFSKQIGKASEIIDTRIATLQKPETQQERELALSEEKAKLGTRATEIDEQLKAFEGSNDGRKKQADIAIEIQAREGKIISNITDIDNLIKDINDELNVGTGGVASLRTQLSDVKTKINAKYDTLLTDFVTRITALNPKDRKIDPTIFAQLRQDAVDFYAGELDPINQQIKVAVEKRDKLITLKNDYQDAGVSIAKADQEQAGKAQVDLTVLENKVTDITTATVNAITKGELSTLPFDQLITKTMDVENPPGTKLFPTKELALQAVMQARSELKANDEEGSATYTDAQKKVRRYRILLQSEKQYITERQAEIDAQKSKIGTDIQQEIARLEGYKAALPTIKDVSDRQGELFSEVREELTQRIEQYVSIDLVDAVDDKYTPVEKSTLHPKGYYEMLDLIFKYKESPNREQVFTHLNKIMPPNKLATMLQNYLITPSTGVGLGPKNKDLPDIFKYIQTNKGRFTASDYRRAMGSIINDLRQEALAFTKI